MMSAQAIHVLGASGAGTSTLGRAIGSAWDYAFLDIDDYYWLPSDPPFQQASPVPQRQDLLQTALEAQPRAVLAGSMTGWGDIFLPHLALVIFLYTPTELRLERLAERERQRFGARLEADDDMHDNHRAFLEWAAHYDDYGLEKRSLRLHHHWLERLSCPVLQLNGAQPVSQHLQYIARVSPCLT